VGGFWGGGKVVVRTGTDAKKGIPCKRGNPRDECSLNCSGEKKGCPGGREERGISRHIEKKFSFWDKRKKKVRLKKGGERYSGTGEEKGGFNPQGLSLRVHDR